MSIWEILLISAVSALDGLLVGVAEGLKGERLRGWRLIHISLWCVPFGMASMLLAGLLETWLPAGLLTHLGGILLILAGLWALYSNLRPRKATEDNTPRAGIRAAIALGVALALDSSVACLSLGLMGGHPFLIPLVFGGTQLLFVLMGNRLGTVRRLPGKVANLLPGCVLLGMGILKVLPL